MTEDHRTAAQDAAGAHLRDLLEAHLREAQDSADDDGKFSIGLRVIFDRSFNTTKLEADAQVLLSHPERQ